MEQLARFELATDAWQAPMLPLHHSCMEAHKGNDPLSYGCLHIPYQDFTISSNSYSFAQQTFFVCPFLGGSRRNLFSQPHSSTGTI